MRSIRTAVDRAALGAVGVALLLGGVWLAAGDRALAQRLPAWWPAPAAGTVLLDGDRLARWRGAGWWTPAVMAAAIGLTVLFAWLSLARLRRAGTGRRLALPAPGCTVRPQALSAALTERVLAVPGVVGGRARVTPRRGRRLEADLRVRLAPDTPPGAVLPALRAVAAEAGRAAEPYTVHTRIRLSAAAHRTPHVR
ncbi:hypothetical protein ACIRU8_04300 [Streptomyces sp. NPDC101175]|uniref:hypothetical protein n=1 Tax=Streptomyces sp. NPDC101175 TaxID=3366123 RepID=UPI0038382333